MELETRPLKRNYKTIPGKPCWGQSEKKKKCLRECLELGTDRERSLVCSEGDAPVILKLVTGQYKRIQASSVPYLGPAIH